MAKIELKFVNSFYDRHGKLRHQFRRKGHPKKLLPGLPDRPRSWKPTRRCYRENRRAPTLEIGARRTKAGTIDAVIAAYKKDDAFTKALAQATQDMRRPILDRFRETCAPSGQRYGEKQLATLQRGHIVKMLEGMTPDARRIGSRPFAASWLSPSPSKCVPTIRPTA